MRKWFRFDFGMVGIVAVGMITAMGMMSCMQRKVEGARNAHKDTAQTAHRKYVGTDDSGRLAYWIPVTMILSWLLNNCGRFRILSIMTIG